MPTNEMKNKIYEALTVQALLMRNEIYNGGGIDKDCFDNTYLNGLGEYERKIAKHEGIELE